MPLLGLDVSFADPENGMIKSDMQACVDVANQLDEVIIFRSTGPWSRRWIERSYPTKNFHVKGKSSDWGPQAGFVPYLGIYSKVGHKADKAAEGTKKNDEGIATGYAVKRQLVLTHVELVLQRMEAEEAPQRLAVYRMEDVPGSKDRLLFAKRSGDDKEFAFLAQWADDEKKYKISVYPESAGLEPKKLLAAQPKPLQVMTSSEDGARDMPMTGDYDLMAVCPTWGNYGSRSVREVKKEGLVFTGPAGRQPGLAFKAGTNLDKVLDMRTNTGSKAKPVPTAGDDEHPDMGNLTPRILRCINALNVRMGAVGDRAPFRRVHHNAESHRNAMFGALKQKDMEEGDGFPLTVFQSPAVIGHPKMTSYPVSTLTLKTHTEFKAYATALNEAGYFVPKNWTWGMSIRDRTEQPPFRV